MTDNEEKLAEAAGGEEDLAQGVDSSTYVKDVGKTVAKEMKKTDKTEEEAEEAEEKEIELLIQAVEEYIESKEENTKKTQDKPLQEHLKKEIDYAKHILKLLKKFHKETDETIKARADQIKRDKKMKRTEEGVWKADEKAHEKEEEKEKAGIEKEEKHDKEAKGLAEDGE